MSNFLTKILSASSALILGACTQVGINLANMPAHFSNTQIIKDISYGDEEWQKLDLYIPAEAKNQKLPVVMFFYGGRWEEGNKEIYKFIGNAFAKKEYIVVIADYSKYPEVKFPTFIEDAAAAIAWTSEHIDTYGGIKERIYLTGHSSGAHIAALAIADDRYLQKHNKNVSTVKAFVGLAGPYDFVPEAEDLKDMFGPPDNYPNMQIPTFINGNEPPMLLLWGAKDTAVIQRNLDRLKDKIESKSGIVETKIYPEIYHFQIITNFTWFLPSNESVINDTVNFFEKHK